MITDPAWFYSSLAQASAAIVGLMGGILAARLSDHVALKRRELAELMSELTGVQRHLISRQDHLARFAEYLRKELALNAAASKAGQTTREGRVNVMGWGFTGSGGRQTINVTEDTTQREPELRLVEAVLPFYRELSGRITADKLSAAARALRAAGGEQVSGDVDPLERAVSKVQRFKETVLPRSFPVVVALLAWLSGVGVVWPLIALPGMPGDPWMGKPAMLLAFATGIIGLLMYLSIELVGIWRLGIISAPTRRDLGL